MPGGTLDKYVQSGDTRVNDGGHRYTFRGFNWVSCAEGCGKRVKEEGHTCQDCHREIIRVQGNELAAK